LDSYIGSGHNYYLYHRESDNRFVIFPWDPNEAWGNFNMGLAIDQLQRLPPDYMPRPMAPPGQPPPPQGQAAIRPLASRLWALPELRDRYRALLRELQAGHAHPDSLMARMLVLKDMVRPWVEKDTKKMFPTSQFETSFTEDFLPRPVQPQPGQPPPMPGMPIPGLEPFLRGRAAYLAVELER
jgi:hypothetical protein